MLPKRKLIKKPRHENKSLNFQETEIYDNPQSLIQRLKSPIPQIKQQAISVLANLRCMLEQLNSQQFLRELINILYQSNTTLCHQTLYAITNLCELSPKVVNRMFHLGFDKALINLQATSQNLLKPILVFFITVNQHIKQDYRYLVEGIRQSLSVNHLLASTELCLEFLYRTRGSAKTNKLSQQIIGEIFTLYKVSEVPSVKSYCVGILCYEVEGEKTIDELLMNYLMEELVVINLQQEYEMNFEDDNMKEKLMQQQQNGGKLSNYNINKHQHQQNQLAQQQMQQQTLGIKHHSHGNNEAQKEIQKRENKMKYFLSAVSGIEVLVEFILDVMETQEGEEKDEWDEDDQDQDQEEDDEMMEGEKIQGNHSKDQQQHQKSSSSSISSITHIKQIITHFLHENMPIFPKYLSTHAPGTQNLVYLFYHLLLHTSKTLPQNNRAKEEINKLIQVSLVSLFMTVDTKRESLSYEEYEVLVQCLEIGLGVVMKHKALGVSDRFLIEFTKKYMMQQSIFHSPKLLQMLKPSWLIMLEIFSLRYNPQKNHNISFEHNYHLGEMLKHLIVSLPYTQLEQFRCQVVDTVFDVYSNEKFDEVFVKLGYFEVLEHIVKQGGSVKEQKGKVKKSKQQKFVADVVKDTKRFLEYKNKMIKHR